MYTFKFSFHHNNYIRRTILLKQLLQTQDLYVQGTNPGSCLIGGLRAVATRLVRLIIVRRSPKK